MGLRARLAVFAALLAACGASSTSGLACAYSATFCGGVLDGCVSPLAGPASAPSVPTQQGAQYSGKNYGKPIVLLSDGTLLRLTEIFDHNSLQTNCVLNWYPVPSGWSGCPGCAQVTWNVHMDFPCPGLLATDSGLAVAIGNNKIYAFRYAGPLPHSLMRHKGFLPRR